MRKFVVCFLLAVPAIGEVAPRHTIKATAVLRDYSHPRHAGDFHEERVQLTIAADAERDALAITVHSNESTDRFVLRGTQLFEAAGAEVKPADGLGDLRASTVAKLDPLYVMSLFESRRENVQRSGPSTILFARGDELWQVRARARDIIDSIATRIVHDLYGDLDETVQYETWLDRGGFSFPSRITVREGERVKAVLDVTSVREGADDELLRQSRAHPYEIYDEDISFREIAPKLFAIELKPSNSRVFVAEFADHLFVIEGAYHDRNVGRIARKIRARFGAKKIRYFSFSHIHGQYVGGVRTYLAGGATVITTPTGAEVVREIATKANVETVAKSRTFEDASNAMTVYNVDSQHTDDYFVFYFPKQKMLLAGDLLCHRGVETPLRGRSKHLCQTVESLGIDVERIYTTWPLEGYGCISPVAFDAFRKACKLPTP